MLRNASIGLKLKKALLETKPFPFKQKLNTML
jgi:hypothetical protein